MSQDARDEARALKYALDAEERGREPTPKGLSKAARAEILRADVEAQERARGARNASKRENARKANAVRAAQPRGESVGGGCLSIKVWKTTHARLEALAEEQGVPFTVLLDRLVPGGGC